MVRKYYQRYTHSVLRLLTWAELYTKIVEELPQMRRETVQLARRAVSQRRHAYVLVNTIGLRGTAPLTVQGLSEMLHG